MQHVLHVNNTGRDTTAYELIIIYIKPNCILSKFQISRDNPRSQTYPSIYIMQQWKRERSRGIPSQGRGERFPPLFSPQIHRFGAGIRGRRPARRLGRRGLESGRGRKGGGRRKGVARALLTRRCHARRGGAAGCMWRGRPGPMPSSTPRLASMAPLPRRCMWRGKGCPPRHGAKRGQRGHRVQIKFCRG
jgi:hypothetical protein